MLVPTTGKKTENEAAVKKPVANSVSVVYSKFLLLNLLFGD